MVVNDELPAIKTCLEQNRLTPPLKLGTIDANDWGKVAQCIERTSVKQAQSHGQRIREAIAQMRPNSPELQRAVQASTFQRQIHQHVTVSHSLYALQLLYWLRLFKKEQVLVIKSEEFFKHTAKVMRLVERHIGLTEFDWSETVKVKYNVLSRTNTTKSMGLVPERATRTKHNITPATIQMLREFYTPYNKLLAEVVGYPGDLWPYDGDLSKQVQ